MLQRLLRAAGIIDTPWTLGRCPDWWGGLDPRAAAAAKNRIRPYTNKYRPHQGATDPDDPRVRCRNCRHLIRASHNGVQCSKTRYRMHQHLLRNCLEFSAIQGRRAHD